MQEDWLTSPASSASASADAIAAAVDRLSQSMEKLQQQMEAQYQITKALTDKVDRMAQHPNAKGQAVPAKAPNSEPNGLPPKPSFQSPRRGEVRFQLDDNSPTPRTPAQPSQAKPFDEQRLPYKSPVSMFQGHRFTSPILPAADSSVDLSLLTPLSTPDRKFPDSLPLEDIDLTKDGQVEDHSEHNGDQRHENLNFSATLDVSSSHELEPLSMLELSQDTTFHSTATRHRRIPAYELWGPNHKHMQLLNQPPFSQHQLELKATMSPSHSNTGVLRDSSFWRRRLDRHATSFV